MQRRKFSHWIEAFLYAKRYTLRVHVQADKTTCEVHDFRTNEAVAVRGLPFAFNTVKADIARASGLKGNELDVFLADNRRRLAGLANIGSKGQWEYAESLLLKWFYQLSGSVGQLREELLAKYEYLRVEIYTPFADLCHKWGYSCCESTLIFAPQQGEKHIYEVFYARLGEKNDKQQ